MLSFLDNLMDEALKKEAASEAKSDNFSSIMKVGMNMHFSLCHDLQQNCQFLWLEFVCKITHEQWWVWLTVTMQFHMYVVFVVLHELISLRV